MALVAEVVGAREVRTRLEIETDRGLTPLVGREREQGLAEALHTVQLIREVEELARARGGA